MPKKWSSNTKVACSSKKRFKATINAFSKIEEGKVIIHLPLITVSEANCFDHWTKKHKRHQEQRKIVAIFLKPIRESIILPCHIKITRVARNKLDKHDNLPMSLKYIVDACCAIITHDYRPGHADNDERISISYDQISSEKYGVILEFSF